MPMAVPFIVNIVVTSLSYVVPLTGIGLTAAVALGHLVAYAAIGYGMTAAARAFGLTPKMPSGSLTTASPLQMHRDPVAPRRVIFGRCRVAGTLVFAHVGGAQNEYLYLVVALAGHQVSEIDNAVYFNDELTVLEGDHPVGVGPGEVRIWRHWGTADQEADSNMVAELPGIWTEAHRLRGIAHLTIRLKYDQKRFPSGIPNITTIANGAIVYDPRDQQNKWSDNPALCIRYYLTEPTLGMAVAASEIDEPSFIAAANVCDELVPLAGGGTEKRYTLNGCFDLNALPSTILDRMVGAMAGFVVNSGGKWYCHAGAHQEPTGAPLTESDLRGPINVQTKSSMRDTANRVRGTYVSALDKYQPVDFPPVTNSTYLEEDNGVEVWRDLELPFTTSGSMAQRLAKIELERTRQDLVVEVPCKLTALRFRAGSTIPVNNSRFGWVAKQFIVTDLKFSVYGTDAPMLGVDLTLRETAAGVWDWNSGEETTYDLAPNTNLGNPRVVAPPTDLLAESGGTITIVQPDGTVVPRIKLTWAAPADWLMQSGGSVRVEYKLSSSTEWLEAGTVKGSQTILYILNPKIGEDYDIRAQSINLFAVRSEWAVPAAGAHTALGDTITPAAPTGLQANANEGGAVQLTWTKHPEPRVNEYGIYRHSTNNPASATKIGEVSATSFVDTTMPLDQASYYWVTAISGSERESAKSTGASATPSSIPDNSIDESAPANPGQLTLHSTGTYQGDDGTTWGWIRVMLPASWPTGAKIVNLKYRKQGSPGWVLVDQFTDFSEGTKRVDDLAPGKPYEFCLQAFRYNTPSAEVLGANGPYASPGSPPPAAPTELTYSIEPADMIRVPIASAGPGNLRYQACMAKWVKSDTKNVDHYEVQAVASPTPRIIGRTKGTECELPIYGSIMVNPQTETLRVRAVGRNELESAWSDQLYAFALTLNYGPGTLADRNANAVGALSGVTSLALTSSRRYKRKFKPLDGAASLKELRKWHPSSFLWRNGHCPEGQAPNERDIGFPAEDVAKVRPVAVVRNDGKVESLQYHKSTPLLAAGVTHLEDRLKAVERVVRTSKSRKKRNGRRHHQRG